jgi:XTP/dITP diphosphohydrolase
LVTLEAFPGLPDVVEDGLTFAENAHKKALHYFQLTQLPTIADDSGLSVDALGGKPGVHSARFASTDPERVAKLLRLLGKVEDPESRKAHFVCAICVIPSAKSRIEVEGEVHGEIAFRPEGTAGFGYDPIFIYPPLGKTFAELDPEEKNRVSHRAIALQKLRLAMGLQHPGVGP